jgi:lysophospholipase L1-like esterase
MKKILFLILVPFLLSLNLSAQKKSGHHTQIDADNPKIKYTGRVDFSNPKAPRFAWSGISIKAAFEGSHCQVILHDFASGTDIDGQPNANYYNFIIDNKKIQVIKCDKEGKQIYNVESLSDTIHTIEIFKRTEASVGESEFRGFILAKGKKLLSLPAAQASRRMEFIGNSITCGYGNEGDDEKCPFSPRTENNYMAYGAITARKLNAEYVAVPFSGKGLTRNFDEGTNEIMPQLYDRIFPANPDKKWDFKKYTPDVVVINLGTNDFAKSNPDSVKFVNAYINFIGKIRSNYPNAHIVCVSGSMMSDNWPQGAKSLTTIQNYIKSVIRQMDVKEDKKVYTFSISSQGSLGYGCDWHPNIAQHKKNAAELTAFIKEKVGW